MARSRRRSVSLTCQEIFACSIWQRDKALQPRQSSKNSPKSLNHPFESVHQRVAIERS